MRCCSCFAYRRENAFVVACYVSCADDASQIVYRLEKNERRSDDVSSLLYYWFNAYMIVDMYRMSSSLDRQEIDNFIGIQEIQSLLGFKKCNLYLVNNIGVHELDGSQPRPTLIIF